MPWGHSGALAANFLGPGANGRSLHRTFWGPGANMGDLGSELFGALRPVGAMALLTMVIVGAEAMDGAACGASPVSGTSAGS